MTIASTYFKYKPLINGLSIFCGAWQTFKIC